jgi:hypothetical protein
MAASGRDRDVVKAVMPELLGAKDAVLKTAVVEFDTTRVAGLMVRVESKESCRGDECRTVFFRAGSEGWRAVFDRRAKTVEFGKPGFGAVRQVVVDGGYEVWGWTGDTYHADVAAAGALVDLKPAPKSATPQLVQQFGAGAKRLFDKKGALTVSVAAVDLTGKGSSQVLARLAGPGACGVVLGCPWRVLEVKDGAYRTLLRGQGSGKIAVMSVARGGWRDLAAELPSGFVTYGWGGSAYGIAETVKDGGAR